MDLRKYLALFVSEAGEHLAGMGAGLVRIEAAARAGEPFAEEVDELFRHAHSMKGMAASMEQDGIARLAHSAEDLLAAVRERGAPPTGEEVDLLLAACDALQGMVSRAAVGEAPEPEVALLARCEVAVRGSTGSPRTERHRFAIAVRIAESCQVPAVRGFLVLKKLALLGGVVEATPGVEELRGGRIPERRLRVLLETAEPREVVLRALSQISDLAETDVTPVEPAVAPALVREPVRAPEGARTLRVRTDLLDQFLDLVGELLLATARVREVGRGLPEEHQPRLAGEVDRLHATVTELHDQVMAARMTPVAVVTEQLPRAARDLARRTGKQVEVDVQGQRIEIDRAVLDEIADPLLHLLRNAVDHGIEAPHLRLLAGKPATGRIEISARRERDRVVIEVHDDGKGMDPEQLRRAAVARGALSESAAASLGVRECLLLSCLPGVSTAASVTDLSGRGVGMDAVKRAVEGVGGTVEIESAPGLGTRVLLRLPLTVAVQAVLLVQVGDEVLGVPLAKVHGAAHADIATLERSRGEPVLSHAGRLVPVRELSELLGFGPPGAGQRAVVIAEGDGAPVGLAVDALLGQQDAVLRPLAGALERVQGLSAVTVLGNGRPVFILDVLRLLAA